jgi:beta-galactosidase GanA
MHYKPGLEKPRNLPGKVLKDLLKEIGIAGNDAADLVGYYLGYSRQAVQAMMSRTIRTNDYELLRYRLTEYKVAAMVADKFHGPIREDGKRHRKDDWLLRAMHDAELKREHIRRKRALDPMYGRKPKSTTRSTLKKNEQ